MNQNIKDNQHKIGTAIDLCYIRIDRISTAVVAYRDIIEKLDKNVEYSAAYLTRQKNEAEKDCRQKLEGATNELAEQLEVIRGSLEEMESILDFGTDLQNALSLVNDLGKELPNESRYSLVDSFRGQPQALNILQAAFRKVGLDPVHYFESAMFTAEKVHKDLEALLGRVATSISEGSLPAFYFAQALEKLSACVGADNQQHASDLDVFKGGYADVLMNAAGLNKA